MSLDQQVDELVSLGVPALAGLTDPAFRDLAARHQDRRSDRAGSVLVVHPELVPASRLARLLTRAGRPGFVVEDMTDLDAFQPIAGLEIPDQPLYLLTGIDRGDDLLNWSPDEALPEFARRARTPLTISEGISWLLQDPGRLEPNRCFMCIGSRKPGPRGRLDARTPAIWISGGTGRDGRERRQAPKVGWCWAGNKHTWLGFASAAARVGAAPADVATGALA